MMTSRARVMLLDPGDTAVGGATGCWSGRRGGRPPTPLPGLVTWHLDSQVSETLSYHPGYPVGIRPVLGLGRVMDRLPVLFRETQMNAVGLFWYRHGPNCTTSYQVSASIVPRMLIVARSPEFPPDHTAISSCPTAMAGTASATVSAPAEYDWPTSRFGTPFAPR